MRCTRRSGATRAKRASTRSSRSARRAATRWRRSARRACTSPASRRCATRRRARPRRAPPSSSRDRASCRWSASPISSPPTERAVLFELSQWLAVEVRAFNVFTYITLRVVLAALTALAISFMVGPAMIRKLAAYKIGQAVRDDGPATHLIKKGTPTMGGALILVAVLVTTLLWADLQNRYVWTVLPTTRGFGPVGWVGDCRTL